MTRLRVLISAFLLLSMTACATPEACRPTVVEKPVVVSKPIPDELLTDCEMPPYVEGGRWSDLTEYAAAVTEALTACNAVKSDYR